MSDTVKFRPAFRFAVLWALWRTLAILVVALIAAAFARYLAGTGVMTGVAEALKIVVLIAPLSVATLSGILYSFGAIWPVVASPKGITCWTRSGRKTLVLWDDIATVTPFSAFGIQMLRITRSAAAEPVTLPMYADRIGDVAKFAAANAPASNVLSTWLNGHARSI